MSSRTTAHTPTDDTMIGASLGRVTELEIVGSTTVEIIQAIEDTW